MSPREPNEPITVSIEECGLPGFGQNGPVRWWFTDERFLEPRYASLNAAVVVSASHSIPVSQVDTKDVAVRRIKDYAKIVRLKLAQKVWDEFIGDFHRMGLLDDPK